MKFQYSIGALIAANYFVAILFADAIGATLFLFLIQPLIVLIAGGLLDSAVPKKLKLAARENTRRLDGTKSERRKEREQHERRRLRLKIFLLSTLVVALFNFVLLLTNTFSGTLQDKHVLFAPIVIAFTTLALCVATCSIYLALIRQYTEEIAERYLEYVQLDMERRDRRQLMCGQPNICDQVPEFSADAGRILHTET
jgi:MFS family permease